MKLVIFGNTKYARMIAYYFSSDSSYELIAFTVHKDFINEHNIDGLPVVDFESLSSLYPPDEYCLFIALGYGNMRFRRSIFNLTKSYGYKHANYISSKSSVDKTLIFGENNLILHGAVIEPFVTIGDNVCINSGTVICHHSIISNHCFIAAGCVVGGNVNIRENSFLGFNSTILQKSVLATETLISANSMVTKNTEPSTRYQGIPAKPYSQHLDNGIKI
ncbi:acetyltransferase [Psychromonas arctica]|uniref:acetyltransferase n=1 Tax=Psychromonas arctica TaxID=168275 RepID=UPI002FCEA90E